MKRLITLLIISLTTFVDVNPKNTVPEEGVSWSLAKERKELIYGICYDLSFTIPETKDEPIKASESVSFSLKRKRDVVLDFREESSLIRSVKVNGSTCSPVIANSHIILPKKVLRKGKNNVEIEFTAGEQSLNRRDDYLYTLFVPDRARTTFPCFDQPDMKAIFRLQLTVPKQWLAVSNAPVHSETVDEKNRYIHFSVTSLLPTYLFAFAAGEFNHTKQKFGGGREIGAYYRDIDSAKASQIPEVLRQVIHSIKWLEEYTMTPYPFRKYDLVILPGFQFGGMEHAGATFYNDTRLFVPENPTPEDLITRATLIAHETAHMWFGDFVTMKWFDDVWTKEVFANYFAARITEPLFPEVDHELDFYRQFQCAAISQDRTDGRTSIRQPLDNLNNSGLIYNNIIYNKAPVMMKKLVSLMGEEAFRYGIIKYLSEFRYGNATWQDLIRILDEGTKEDLAGFSHMWVDNTYWPTRNAVAYTDALDAGYYGFTKLTAAQADSLMENFPAPSAASMAGMMTLYENYLNHGIPAERFLEMMMEITNNPRSDELTCLRAVDNMAEALRETPLSASRILELVNGHRLKSVRTKALRLLIAVPTTDVVTDMLYSLWQSANSPYLSEKDYMSLAYELAIRMPEKSLEILDIQRQRIGNADLSEEFDFVSRGSHPSEEYRDSVFLSLQKPENRRIEPWTAALLANLNHPIRQQEAVKYIRPALEWLPDIQRTGDIFFPGRWCDALLSGHRSKEVLDEVTRFLDSHSEMNPLLKNKILSAMFFLNNANQ